MCDLHSSSYHPLHEQILKLTIALYRVTDYFPKSEILRNDLRSKANEIFEQITEYRAGARHDEAIELLIGKVRTIKGYMEIASTLRYVRSLNFTILAKEYDLIEQFLETEKTEHIKQLPNEGINEMEHNSSAYGLAEKITRNPERKKESEENHANAISREIEVNPALDHGALYPVARMIEATPRQDRRAFKGWVKREKKTIISGIHPHSRAVRMNASPGDKQSRAEEITSRRESSDFRTRIPSGIPRPAVAGRASVISETEALGVGFHERMDSGLNERQRVIMDRLVRSGRGKISDFYTSLKGVSSKTIQRDLQNLVDKEMLKKEGEKRWTVYSVIEK